jgi:hypothetical protein
MWAFNGQRTIGLCAWKLEVERILGLRGPGPFEGPKNNPWVSAACLRGGGS